MTKVEESAKATDSPEISRNIPGESRKVQPKSTMPYQNVLIDKPGPYRVGADLPYPYIDR